MSIAGHVSRAMLSRDSHVRMEAKRRALDDIAARQRQTDEKRVVEGNRHARGSGVSGDKWFRDLSAPTRALADDLC
jgi:hypothetical protein